MPPADFLHAVDSLASTIAQLRTLQQFFQTAPELAFCERNGIAEKIAWGVPWLLKAEASLVGLASQKRAEIARSGGSVSNEAAQAYPNGSRESAGGCCDGAPCTVGSGPAACGEPLAGDRGEGAL